jgi:hypothetical protein
MVHLREYSDPLDLLGKDLISLLRHSKDDVSKLVGAMAAKSEMKSETLPGDYVTSLTGEVADEVHEWPNTTLGPDFRHLILQFREGRLVHMIWKFPTSGPLRRKSWWRFW